MEWSMFMSTTQLAILTPFVLVSMGIIRRFVLNRAERKGRPLPPGPTPLPILGSALSVDTEEPFKTYTRWQAKYGDIMYIQLFDTDAVVLNSIAVATELLDKRSKIYSDRPSIPTIQLYGQDCNFAFAPYGEHWRLCRRIFHQTFRAEAIVNFQSMQLDTARQLILNVMDDPDDYPSHYSTFAATVTMRSVYDYDPSPRDDGMVSIINNFLQLAMPAGTSERSLLIKIFPFLLYIPEWLPGSWIRREARVSREWGVKMVETPFQYVKEKMRSKDYDPSSMVADHITRMEKFDDAYRLEYEKALKHASSTAFIGATETTSSALMTFTLAMVENPRIWKRAQAEIDAIVGTDRLPELDDRSSLPYVEAILRETWRWQPPVPLDPHATTSDDVYEGFYIPKGAAAIANIWGMSRDARRYRDADAFIPERFLDAEGVLNDDKADFVFGFGRRMCPGRHVGDASVWCGIVTMLATLDFNPAKDAEGKDVVFEAVFVNGVTRHPVIFPCSLMPRPHISKAMLERFLAK